MTPDLITAEAWEGEARASTAQPVPWWSFGKTVVAAAALVLVDQGRVGLDQRFPPFGVSLRETLQHRAGLPDYGELADYHAEVARGHAAWPAAEMLSRLGAGTATGFRYSNVGYFLVRTWIEHVVGAPLGVALDALVFQPSGVEGVRVAMTRAAIDGVWGISAGYDPAWVYPGLLVGPPAGAARFLHELLAGRLLAPATLAAMREALPVGGPVSGRPWVEAGYGMGLMVGATADPATLVGHTGGGPGSVCAVYQAHPGRTTAVFAPDTHPARAERGAIAAALKVA